MPDLENPVTFISFFLTIYNWGAVCVLLFFHFLIAGFYENKSRRRYYYSAFLVSIAFFIFATYRYAAVVPVITGDVLGDLARFGGGLILGIFGLLLVYCMMGGRP